MANVAGKTVLQVGVDGTQATAGIDDIKKSVGELNAAVDKTAKSSAAAFKVQGQASDDAGNRINAAGRRTIKSLETQANRLEMTTAEFAAWRAAQAGVTNAGAPLIARIDAATKSTVNLGMSAKATAASMRGVPAQITDIVTSLQGGQAPLTVFLQQGGQLKDMFGGVVPAARALGSSIAGMVNPFTLVIAGAAAVAAAYYKGSQETTKFNSLLLETGNYAGTTAASLSQIGDAVAKSTGGSRSTAVSALQEIAQSGKFASQSFDLVASAAVNLEKVTGQEVGKTVQQFARLQDEPTKAAAELNRQYNFLTASVYEQIKALEGQGEKTEAARVASEAFANAIESRKGQVVANIGTFERAWDAVARTVARARDEVLKFGRDEGLAGQLRDAEQKLTQLQDGAYERGAAQRVRQVTEQRAIVDEIKERVRMEQTLAAQQGATARAVQSQIEQSGIRSAYLGDSSRQTLSGAMVASVKKEEKEFKAAIVGLAEDSKEYQEVYRAHQTALKKINDDFAKASAGPKTKKKKEGDPDPLGSKIFELMGEEEQAYQSFLQRIAGSTAAAEARQRQDWLDRGLLAGELSQQQYDNALDKIQLKAGTTFTQTSEFAVQAARNIQDSLGDGLHDILTGNFDDIGSSFGNMILKMAADATAANLAQALFGDYGKTNQIGGLLGGLASILFGTGGYGSMTQDTSSMTGSWGSVGGRAIGGPVSSGSMYRVNENGSPELATVGSKQYLMMGNQSGSVTPMKALTGGAAPQAAPQVEFNLINQSSQPVQAKGGDMRFDGKKMIQDVFIVDMKSNGPMARAMKGVMA